MPPSRVGQNPGKVPNESITRREWADDWQETVIEPLQKMRDNLHWLAVHRRKPTANWFEQLVETILSMARQYAGRLVRGEE